MLTGVKAGARPAYSVYSGVDLAAPAYRVCESCPPTSDDFLSYLLAGRTNFSDRLFFRATGVSMFVKQKEAMKLARGGSMGTCVATLDLSDDRLYFALTNEKTGHIDVWGRSRLLLSHVVDCVDTGRG
jgi:hypothetical protein